MVKSGLIMGAVMFVLALAAGAVISQFCTPCLALFIGLGAGYLAGVYDKPALQNDALKKGAIAGAIAGGIGILGQLIAGVINASYLRPETLNNLFGQNLVNQQMLWLGQMGGAVCIGLFNVLFMAGLGVGGAAIWNAMRNQNQTPPPVYPPQQY